MAQNKLRPHFVRNLNPLMLALLFALLVLVPDIVAQEANVTVAPQSTSAGDNPRNEFGIWGRHIRISVC